jgi:AraC family transcriptional regulator of adaptative response / DNA-3-methyladenine glycosylase II
MAMDAASCYRALETHDARFDGRFFVGVSSTRIYCRPVCRVRTPRADNCRYFPSAAAAEVAGYRPCLRCRPELAPGYSSVDANERLAQAAVALIEGGVLDDGGHEHLAARLGVTSRHVRRIFERSFGVTPVEYAQTQRLLLAKRLLTDTALPVTDVALASGFRSVRRFNALWKARYRMAPTALRRAASASPASSNAAAAMHFELADRPPYEWDGLLRFLAARAIAGVESVSAGAYRRTLAIRHRGERHVGTITVRPAPRRAALALDVSPSLARVLPQVLSRLRHAFDLGCHPDEVARVLGTLADGAPGLRLPGTMDGFELAVRAVVGQQVSVAAARTLLGRIAARHGEPLPGRGAPALLFPSADALAALDPQALSRLGVLPARARTLVELAGAVAAGTLDLDPGADVDRTRGRLDALRGIGPWTREYIVMRALGWPDAFPAGDLVILRALGVTRAAHAEARSAAWRPWRAYAVLHLWRGATP